MEREQLDGAGFGAERWGVGAGGVGQRPVCRGLVHDGGGKFSAYIARAYLLPLPALSVLRSGTDVMVSWPSVDTAGFALEQAGTLSAPASWVTNAARVTDDGATKSVTIPATNSPQFF